LRTALQQRSSAIWWHACDGPGSASGARTVLDVLLGVAERASLLDHDLELVPLGALREQRVEVGGDRALVGGDALQPGLKLGTRRSDAGRVELFDRSRAVLLDDAVGAAEHLEDRVERLLRRPDPADVLLRCHEPIEGRDVRLR